MGGKLHQHAGRVLIVGGGIGGPAAAIRFAERGMQVDLVDIESAWGAAGTGLTLSPLTARALCDLGFAPALMAQGHMHDSLQMLSPDGRLLDEIIGRRLYAPDVPAEGGVMRPVLHRMMAARMADLGVRVRTGTTVTALEQGPDGVEAVFPDGSVSRYDLVIGADGLYSKIRSMILPDAPAPRYTGQVCWRAQLARPQDWDCARVYFGPVKLGFIPCGPREMYLFLLENVAQAPWYERAQLLPAMRRFLEPFPALAWLRDTLDETTPILARPLETILLDDPWHVGRVILIGDAAHATTPHLASGAGMAVEDAIVLVDELDRTADYEAALRAFMARRLPRGKRVVGDSLRLGELEQAGAPGAEIGALMAQSLRAIAEPY